MAQRGKLGTLKKGLRDFDDIFHLITGKRLKNVAGTAVNLWGEELARKVGAFFTGPDEPEVSLDSPYSILGVHPDALDIVVKGAYRSLAREYHPDTGTNPDPVKFQKVTEAYNAIMAERKQARNR